MKEKNNALMWSILAAGKTQDDKQTTGSGSFNKVLKQWWVNTLKYGGKTLKLPSTRAKLNCFKRYFYCLLCIAKQ